MRSHRKKLAFTTVLIVFFTILSLKIFASPTPTVTITPNVTFGLASNSTTINFSETQMFNTLSMAEDYWAFNGYGFQPDNANMTITRFFTNNKLEFTLFALNGTNSTTKILVAEKGEPNSVEVNGVSVPIDYNATTKVVTVTVVHTSPAEVTITWLIELLQAFSLSTMSSMFIVGSGIFLLLTAGFLAIMRGKNPAQPILLALILSVTIMIIVFVVVTVQNLAEIL